MAKKRAKKQNERPTQIEFDYIKSNLFRVIPIDGAFGGLSPNAREIHMALFNERRPLPKKTIHPIAPDGTLGKEDLGQREARKAFVREVEIDVVLDLQTAVVLQTWLQDKIQQMAKIQGIELKPIVAAAATTVTQKPVAKIAKGNGKKVLN